MSPTASSPSREKYRALLASASRTAGSDNWKTTAGRLEGPDGFVPSDAWRLLKQHFKSSLRPAVCPVCMDKPSSDDEWYVTKTCKHAVCRDCLQSYALSLISDANHAGPLKCPCCPRLLRTEDAKVALDKLHGGGEPINQFKRKVTPKAVMKRVVSKRHPNGGLFADQADDEVNYSALEVLEQWDAKTRDEFLRSMADFRPCPHCSGGNSTNGEGGGSATQSDVSVGKELHRKGGGFVTPDCLAPIHRSRESNAVRLVNMAGPPVSKAVLLIYAAYYLYCGAIEFDNPLLQILSAIVPSVLLPILPHAIRLLLVSLAKQEVMRPIIVTCPCCEKPFNLEASSELQIPGASATGTAAESATQSWKDTNTRPCPGCSSPIMKDGGCNHVKCGRCRVEFCWGCMRSRTRCRAYQCRHGAPYGNAFGDGSLAAVAEGLNALERERQGRTLMERIDYVEAAALRNLRLFRTFPFRHVALIGIIFFAVTSLGNPNHIASIAWNAGRRAVSLAASLLITAMRVH
ncbi:hypothetical protein ACHAXT_010191 [Thalassiosira profunda]